MRRSLLVLVVAFTLVACSGSGTTTTPTDSETTTSLITIEVPELGFAIDHPADWAVLVKPEESILEVVAPQARNGFVPNFNVTTGDLPAEVPRAIYYEGEITRLESTLPGVQILEVANVNVDGVPGRGITLTSTENDQTIGISRLLVLTDEGRAYELSFFAAASTLEDLAPDVTEIFQSFRFLG